MVHSYSFLGQLQALLILVPMCVLIGQGIVGLIFWFLDRKHDAMTKRMTSRSATAHLAMCDCDQCGLLDLSDHRVVLAIKKPEDETDNSLADQNAHR
ncbi:hypothetical protein GUH64_18380, partial [Xanthomonas citri pv. citri]|nr:hypothetical protein [Xanthomonas citri pv. citri]